MACLDTTPDGQGDSAMLDMQQLQSKLHSYELKMQELDAKNKVKYKNQVQYLNHRRHTDEAFRLLQNKKSSQLQTLKYRTDPEYRERVKERSRLARLKQRDVAS